MAVPTFDVFIGFSTAYTLNGDDTSDYFGASVARVGDIDNDGIPDIIVGMPLDNGGSSTGAARVFSGVDGSVINTLTGSTLGREFGRSVAGFTDVNGDGVGDYAIGEIRGASVNGTTTGIVRVYSGSTGNVLYELPGEANGDFFGTSLAVTADINGDGIEDLIVGAQFADGGAANGGKVYVYSGANGALLTSYASTVASEGLGVSVGAAGDVNNDGTPDIIVGGGGLVGHGDPNAAGITRVISGTNGALLHTFTGAAAGDQLGIGVAGAGDVNGDGFDDVLIGIPGANTTGVDSGSVIIRSGANGAILDTFNGTTGGDSIGRAVANSIDFDGDGVADIIAGAPSDSTPNGVDSGSLRVISGANGQLLGLFPGDTSFDVLGLSVAALGDLNGDGLPDLIAGSPQGNGAAASSGIARVYTTVVGQSVNSTSYTEGAPAVSLDTNVQISDDDFDALNSGDGNYDGASLTIVRGSGMDAEDVFAFGTMTNVTVSGGNLQSGSQTIATFTNTGGELAVDFTDANGEIPTRDLVNEILSAVTYENTSDAPPATVTLDWSFSDGTDTETVQQTVIVGTVNDEPTLTATGESPTFTEPVIGPPVNVVLFSIADVSTVEAGQLLNRLTVTLTGVVDGNSERLAFNGDSVQMTDLNSVTAGGVTADVSFPAGTTATVTFNFTGGENETDFETFLNTLAYRNSNNNPTEGDRVVTLTALMDDGGTANMGDDTAALNISSTVTVVATNDNPTMSGLPTDITVTEDIASDVDLSIASFGDIDSGANDITLTVVADSGVLSGVDTGGVVATGNGTGTLVLTGRSLEIDTYLNTASNIRYTGALNVNGTAAATLTLTADDGGNSGAGGGGTVALGSVNIDITAVDDPGLAEDDAFATDEANTVGGDVHGANPTLDSDVDTTPLTVTEVNGAALTSGVAIALPSGALLTMYTDGTFSYDPNSAFDATPGAASGASNTVATDSFTYANVNSNTATVTVNITGLDSDGDVLVGTSGNDTLDAGIGNDLVNAGAGMDDIQGGTGNDRMYGEAGNDTIRGGTGINLLNGGGDDDMLFGGSEVDTLGGGLGNDTMFGGSGNDFFFGDGGSDRMYGEGDNDTMNGLADNDIVNGGDGNDIMRGGGGIDLMGGGLGDDTMYGGDSHDNMFGDGGMDRMFGEDGNDFMKGLNDDDIMRGGAGRDRLNGGLGDDNLGGGSGADTYIFQNGWGNDIIADFENGLDLIDMRQVAGANSYSDLVVTFESGSTFVRFGGNEIRLFAESFANIGSEDFLF